MCGEWEWGGLPAWLLENGSIPIRTDASPYIDAALQWWERTLMPQIAPLLYSKVRVCHDCHVASCQLRPLCFLRETALNFLPIICRPTHMTYTFSHHILRVHILHVHTHSLHILHVHTIASTYSTSTPSASTFSPRPHPAVSSESESHICPSHNCPTRRADQLSWCKLKMNSEAMATCRRTLRTSPTCRSAPVGLPLPSQPRF